MADKKHEQKEPRIYRTNSNSDLVETYPTGHIPADGPEFLFSTAREVHLYSCDAHPYRMGVVK